MEEQYLAHHGIKGMKWGVRRYRNKDGSLTAAGKKRKTTLYELARNKTGISKVDDPKYQEKYGTKMSKRAAIGRASAKISIGLIGTAALTDMATRSLERRGHSAVASVLRVTLPSVAAIPIARAATGEMAAMKWHKGQTSNKN